MQSNNLGSSFITIFSLFAILALGMPVMGYSASCPTVNNCSVDAPKGGTCGCSLQDNGLKTCTAKDAAGKSTEFCIDLYDGTCSCWNYEEPLAPREQFEFDSQNLFDDE